MILCEYSNERRPLGRQESCCNWAERFLTMVPYGRTIGVCAHHYAVMSDEAFRAWKEITFAEYEVSKVHEQ